MELCSTLQHDIMSNMEHSKMLPLIPGTLYSTLAGNRGKDISCPQFSDWSIFLGYNLHIGIRIQTGTTFWARVVFEASFSWSINWIYHRTDRTSKQQPCHFGTQPAP